MNTKYRNWGAAPLILFCGLVHATEPDALRLGDVATPAAYQVRLEVDPSQPTFTGEVRIDMLVNRETSVIRLNAQDIDVESVTFRQGELPIPVIARREGDDRIAFEATGEKFLFGSTTATIRYRGKLEPNATRGLFRRNEGGKWYVVSQFEALNARRAIPAFDEPGWKTPWQVTVDTPSANVVTSNTLEQASEDIADHPGWKRHRFATTRPLPTYLVAVAVGPFAIVDGGTSGTSRTPLRYVAPAGAAGETRFARASTPRIVDLQEAYFGTPFPFGKLDSVTIPSNVRFGAMENAGMITYARSLILAHPADEALAFQRGYASVAAHEIAHQWFGDLVTLSWWNDVWLNEAFATWMARKTLQAYRPDFDRGWRHGETRRRALQSDRLTSARQIRNPVNDKNDIYGAFDGITYSKGAEVLSMFESWMGEDRFREGVRGYLAKHADGSATSEDFFGAIAAASGKPERASAALRSFVEQPGLPLVDVALACRGGAPSMKLSQHRLVMIGHAPAPQQWITPACFRYHAGGKTIKQCVELTGDMTVPLEGGSCPDWIAGNADGAGHWVARYDAEILRGLDTRVVDIPENEAVALAGDTMLLVESGLLKRDEGFRIASALLRHPSLGGRHGAVYFLEQQPEEALSPAQRQVRRTLLVSYVFPMARSFGWVDSAKDDLATQDLRTLVMSYAARMDGGETLRAPARDLALRWLDDHAALPPSSVHAVLETAARFADAPTFDRLQGALVHTTEPRDRMRLVSAIAATRDPVSRNRVLAMTLQDEKSEGLSSHETIALFESLLEDDANRVPGFAFLRANWDALVAKVPADSGARFLQPLSRLCTKRDRDEFAAFFAARAQALQAGPRRYAQTLEAIDACVASSSAGEKAPAPPPKKRTSRGARR
jgi:alanyl aminopeptidase